MKKVMFTWEHGKSISSLLIMSECAESLRSLFPGVTIILATNRSLSVEDVKWADRVLVSPKITIKTDDPTRKIGLSGALHRDGWTDPVIRQYIYGTWAEVYRSEKPDAVIVCNGVSSLLVALLEEIRVIHIGTGEFAPRAHHFDPEEDPFPELTSWIYRLSPLSMSELMGRPGIVFCDKRVDIPRQGLVFHALPYLPELPKESEGSVLAIWNKKHPLTAELMKLGYRLWGNRFNLVSPNDWVNPWARLSIDGKQSLVISHYQPQVISQAVHRGIPHFGLPTSEYGVEIGRRAEHAGLSMRLDGQLELLKDYADNSFIFEDKARMYSQNSAGYVKLELSLAYLLR